MSILENSPKSKKSILNTYLPVVLKKNKSGWIIEYYEVSQSENPVSSLFLWFIP